MSSPIKLKLFEKNVLEHAQHYLLAYQAGLVRRLSHWRDEQLARKALALAGEPGLVLDLPCGTGRFWSLLAQKQNRIIIGADNSGEMIQAAYASQPAHIAKRVRTLQASAVDIDLPDNSVDCIFSMRLLHHVGEPQHRLGMLTEFYRVTRDAVIISLWVDGNFKSWRRKHHEQRRRARGDGLEHQNRLVIRP